MAKGAPSFSRGRGDPPGGGSAKLPRWHRQPGVQALPLPATVLVAAADAAMANMQAGAPAFKKGGKVGGSFPKGKTAKMPR